MSFSYGFYNSINHDRKYNSLQISKIFDGIINDGVYATLGEAFIIKESPDQEIENMVIIGSGRGWFDHTWNYNDADLPLELEPSEIALDRIDAVILDINSHDDYRQNDIIVIKGDPSNTPERPELIKDEYHKQYPLAYIYRRENDDKIRQADITNMVGTSECPFVTGIIETINIDLLLMQWRDEWVRFVEVYENDANEFYDSHTAAFEDWFDSIQAMLEPDVAAHLAAEILKLKTFKAEKLLLASEWTGDEAPFIYDLSFDWIGNTNLVELIPTATLTAEQVAAYQDAEIVNGAQRTGHLMLFAWGQKPEIDLPVIVLVKGLATGTPPTENDPGSTVDPGITITATSIMYAKNQNGEEIPTSGWSLDFPDIEQASFIWSRTEVHYSDGSTTTTYMAAYSGKDSGIVEAKQYTDEKIAELINGAPTTLDTLKEIADAFEESQEVIDALNEAIGKKVSIEVQSLTDIQKAQVRSNINAAPSDILDKITEGDNITIEDGPNGTKIISSEGGTGNITGDDYLDDTSENALKTKKTFEYLYGLRGGQTTITQVNDDVTTATTTNDDGTFTTTITRVNDTVYTQVDTANVTKASNIYTRTSTFTKLNDDEMTVNETITVTPKGGGS